MKHYFLPILIYFAYAQPALSRVGDGTYNYAPAGRALQGNRPTCTLLIREIQYKDSSGLPDSDLECQLPNGKILKLAGQGRATIEQSEYESGTTQIDMTGATIGDREIILPTGNVIIPGGGQQRRELAIVGTRKVVIVRVIALDAQTTATEAQLQYAVFGPTTMDPVNLVSQYAACSYEQLNFVPGSGNSNIVNGVMTVNININVVGVADSIVRNAVTEAVKAELGQTSMPGPTSNYFMYALPPGTAGGWIAYAYINSWNSVYNDNWATYLSGQMHEIGHNLNLAHSGEGSSEYGDQSGT